MAHKIKQAEELTRLGKLLHRGMAAPFSTGDGLSMDEARELDGIHRRLMADRAYEGTLHEASGHAGLYSTGVSMVDMFIDHDLLRPDYDPYRYCADCYDDWGDYHRPHED